MAIFHVWGWMVYGNSMDCDARCHGFKVQILVLYRWRKKLKAFVGRFDAEGQYTSPAKFLGDGSNHC